MQSMRSPSPISGIQELQAVAVRGILRAHVQPVLFLGSSMAVVSYSTQRRYRTHAISSERWPRTIREVCKSLEDEADQLLGTPSQQLPHVLC